MKKIIFFTITVTIFTVLPTLSQAACRITDGRLTDISVNSATDSAIFVIRAVNVAFKAEPLKTYAFSTTSTKVLNFMLSAKTSNEHVRVTGTGSDECTDFSLGDSNSDNRFSGGTITSASFSK